MEIEREILSLFLKVSPEKQQAAIALAAALAEGMTEKPPQEGSGKEALPV